MDIEQCIQNIIDTCKQHMSSGAWSKNDSIRYAYVTLGKKLSKSTRFFFSLEHKYGDCGLTVEEMKKTIADFFDIDENGSLMPAENPHFSNQFELDNDGAIMPKEAN